MYMYTLTRGFFKITWVHLIGIQFARSGDKLNHMLLNVGFSASKAAILNLLPRASIRLDPRSESIRASAGLDQILQLYAFVVNLRYWRTFSGYRVPITSTTLKQNPPLTQRFRWPRFRTGIIIILSIFLFRAWFSARIVAESLLQNPRWKSSSKQKYRQSYDNSRPLNLPSKSLC